MDASYKAHVQTAEANPSLRFYFELAAVVFRNTMKEIVGLGDKVNYQVVARRGGVCSAGFQ